MIITFNCRPEYNAPQIYNHMYFIINATQYTENQHSSLSLYWIPKLSIQDTRPTEWHNVKASGSKSNVNAQEQRRAKCKLGDGLPWFMMYSPKAYIRAVCIIGSRFPTGLNIEWVVLIGFLVKLILDVSVSSICLTCDDILRLWYDLGIQYNESDECWFSVYW